MFKTYNAAAKLCLVAFTFVMGSKTYEHLQNAKARAKARKIREFRPNAGI